jgi:uncharacterized protein (TIGR02594 family)
MTKFLTFFFSLFGPSAKKQNEAIAAAYPAPAPGTTRTKKTTPPPGKKAPASGDLSSPGAPAPSTPAGDPSATPYDLARRYIGQREVPGVESNPAILRWLRRVAGWPEDDATPWCSAFVNAMAQDAGYEISRSLAARSWLQVGKPVAMLEAVPGDVVILWRGSRDSASGHVGFYVRRDADHVWLLGGNQADAVSVAPYPLDHVLGIRRLGRLRASAE